jgi:hypothetical protein
MGGHVTQGPFVRGDRVGCVVDRRRLAWIDPDKDEVLWTYTSGGEEIVGSPHEVDHMLVVADRAGSYVGLDPATGRPLGPGYQLRANVAPGTSPVAFGPRRLFAPLSDGTVLLIALGRLRGPSRPDERSAPPRSPP